MVWSRSDSVHEEIRQNTKDGTSSKEEGEDFSLVNKGMKAKGKKSQGEVESSQEGKKKYFSKIKCFNCHEYRHYATKCPHKKSVKKNLGGETGEVLASQFELDFTLIACMTNILMGSVWYLDSGASFHMTRCREFIVTWRRNISRCILSLGTMEGKMLLGLIQ